ncbi:hypothetical protein AGMMS50225_27330 [Betaproteobacteria bacterium]|nr:hypothetical protein AGMMS50225_27330 [Betaproteobacteria bacterium]
MKYNQKTRETKMHPHNFSFDLKYSDSTHSCRFTFGSERVKSSIQIVVDLWKLMRMANELGYEECLMTI